ncbi:MAG: MgtC/SapB family protein [Candidatus Promineifilaceae bacterium]|nr:MgtC/SapB family protein [Candidatus Promineifilaceae bacterium]
MDVSWSGFLVDLGLAFVSGLAIGVERELRGKPAGISTHTLIIGASMLFSFLSRAVSPEDPTRVAAQIVTGVGFLGAGVILRFEAEVGESRVTNLTTAASIWFSAAIGMALGFDYHLIAMLATAYVVLIARIPRINKKG